MGNFPQNIGSFSMLVKTNGSSSLELNRPILHGFDNNDHKSHRFSSPQIIAAYRQPKNKNTCEVHHCLLMNYIYSFEFDQFDTFWKFLDKYSNVWVQSITKILTNKYFFFYKFTFNFAFNDSGISGGGGRGTERNVDETHIYYDVMDWLMSTLKEKMLF